MHPMHFLLSISIACTNIVTVDIGFLWIVVQASVSVMQNLKVDFHFDGGAHSDFGGDV